MKKILLLAALTATAPAMSSELTFAPRHGFSNEGVSISSGYDDRDDEKARAMAMITTEASPMIGFLLVYMDKHACHNPGEEYSNAFRVEGQTIQGDAICMDSEQDKNMFLVTAKTRQGAVFIIDQFKKKRQVTVQIKGEEVKFSAMNFSKEFADRQSAL